MVDNGLIMINGWSMIMSNDDQLRTIISIRGTGLQVMRQLAALLFGVKMLSA